MIRGKVSTVIAVTCAIAALSAFAISLVLFFVSPDVREMGMAGAIWSLPFTFMSLIGSLLIWKRSNNTIGWVLAAAGLLMGWNAVTQHYTLYAYAVTPPRWGAATSSWFAFWLWIPASLLMAFFFLIFPTGSALSRWWRPIVWAAFALVVSTLPAAGLTWSSRGAPLLESTTPADIPGGDLLSVLGNGGFLVLIVAGLVSVVMRYRRGGSVERHQVKWLMFAAGLMTCAIAVTATVAIITRTDDPMSNPIVGLITLLASASVPVAAAIAILRYRLYDIDVVINKTFVYFSLAAFITLIYVGVVVGVGTLIGSGDEPNLGLSLAATAVVAVAFQPVRERIQRLANRVVYGQRLSPYEAVTSFSHRMAESLSFDEVLPSVAEAAASAVGGERSKVTLLFPGGGSEEVAWPSSNGANGTGDFDATVSVVHQGTQVGEISVAKKKGEALTQSEQKLLNDLASQAGLAFSNLRLTEELKAKLVELQESRRRIVSAQDEERRRMERDIHDGAQQQLVSMSVKLGLAKSLLTKDSEKASAILEELKDETSEAVETLRDLARGLMPALLSERGVLAAVESHLHKSGLAASVVDQTGGARFPSEIESNLYFVIREALQNASKHAGGSSIVVSLTASDQELRFEVSDGGPGFDPSGAKMGSGLQNMADRIEAIGGRLEIASEPGAGARVFGRVSSGRDGDQARAIERKGT